MACRRSGKKKVTRSYAGAGADIHPLTEYGFTAPDVKQHPFEELGKSPERTYMKKVHVKIKKSSDGSYAIYDPNNQNMVRGAYDYINVLSILARVYGFTEQDIDDHTVRKIKYLNAEESIELPYNK